MIKPGLERYDSPIVIINQVHQGEDWGVVVSYVSENSLLDAGDESELEEIGWHVSVTLPNLEDVDFDKVFSTPETALEFGIDQIVSGKLALVTPPWNEQKCQVYPFGRYKSIA